MGDSPNQITVIISLRLNEAHGDALDRLSYVKHDETWERYARVMVVDDGSPAGFAVHLEKRCAELGYDYLRLETENRVFSIGRCRNQGAMRARTRYIFFQDIDLIPPNGFYEKLAREISIVGLSEHNNNMIMIPVAYLTETATEVYLADDRPGKFQRYMDGVIRRDRSVFEKFSTGTSACLYDRLYYLACGGNMEEFSGWGFEDLEFNTRMTLDSGRYPEPDDWLEDISSFDLQTSYRGWKSAYRLFGDRSFLKGLLLFHAWHPVVMETSYRRRKENNRKIFLANMKHFFKTREHPTPLPAPERGKTLLFRKNAFTFSHELRPLLGEVKLADENSFASKKDFLSFFKKGGFDRILFHNPYANEQMKRLYDWARQAELPFFVAERGALNGGVMFDPTGFLADSAMFDECKWNVSLDAEYKNRIREYVRQERSRVELLEAQGNRTPAISLREKLNITEDEKILLVCLQRPNDTATRFFDGEMGGYQDFVKAVGKLSRQLPENHVMLVKVHPLEREFPDVEGQDASKYHLYDLFDIADRLIVYNSGAGVQALMWDLPVITCGHAFYDHRELTCHVSSYDELKMVALEEKPRLNQQARLRFLSWLVDDYYSFGIFTTRQTRMDNGDRMTSTMRIDFEILRFDGFEGKYYRGDDVLDNWQSMLFDRYLWQKREKVRPLGKLKIKKGRDNPAVLIYKASRNIPHIEQLIDRFVPAYEWLEKRLKSKRSSSGGGAG
jgi:predicted glycosyltransferase involved in capsule biosynthesis